MSMGFDVTVKYPLLYYFTDSTRECTFQEYNLFAKSQLPHFGVLDANLALFVRANAVLEIVDEEDVQQNGLLSKENES